MSTDAAGPAVMAAIGLRAGGRAGCTCFTAGVALSLLPGDRAGLGRCGSRRIAPITTVLAPPVAYPNAA